MSTTEEETTEEDVTTEEEDSSEETSDDEDDEEELEQETFAGKHPIGELLDTWIDWVPEEGKGEVFVDYDEDEDVFHVDRDDREAVIYVSDIDEEFYGDSQAIFVESIIGKPPENLDLSQTLKFSGNELVLSRISLTERNSKFILLVESATPLTRFTPATFDLMVREVATIGRDLRKHLEGHLEE
ncbi:MAG: hypothetical protein WC423_00975 [Vulcanimicrobiota bacterium]